MSEIQPNVSEHEARAAAEGGPRDHLGGAVVPARTVPGQADLGLIHPWPEPDAEEQERGEKFLAALERFLREQVDAERIERDAAHPRSAIIQGLRELGAFGIKILREYGGLELSQYTYCRAHGR